MEIRIAVAQLAPKKGDRDFNLGRLTKLFAGLLATDTPDVLVLPETALTGYFLQGGVLEIACSAADLCRDVQHAFDSARAGRHASMDVVIGFYEQDAGNLYNSALYVELGGHGPAIRHVHRKFFLPTYGVFDEKRYVNRGRRIRTFETRHSSAGILLCEDAWHSMTGSILAIGGAQVIYIPSASPARGFCGETIDNVARWHSVARGIAEEHGVFVVTANLVGFEGGKGLIGASVVVDPFGHVIAQGPVGDECLIWTTLDLDQIPIARASSPLIADMDAHLADVQRELSVAERRGFAEDEWREGSDV